MNTVPRSDIASSPIASELIAIAASMGGVEALIRILSAIPATFSPAVVIIQHRRPYPSPLANVFDRNCALPVEEAREGERIQRGKVYLAPPDRHLTVTRFYRFALHDTPKRNFCRPSADPLFESVAELYRANATALVLTGRGRDGAVGARAVKAKGGRVLVQDEATSAYFHMPYATLATGCVDSVLGVDDIVPALVQFAR